MVGCLVGLFVCLFVCLFVVVFCLFGLSCFVSFPLAPLGVAEIRQAVFDQLKSASHFGDIVEERGDRGAATGTHLPLTSTPGVKLPVEAVGPGLWKAGPAVVVARL